MINSISSILNFGNEMDQVLSDLRANNEAGGAFSKILVKLVPDWVGIIGGREVRRESDDDDVSPLFPWVLIIHYVIIILLREADSLICLP